MAEDANKTTQLVAAIWQLVEPVIRAERMELVEVEYRCEPHGWVLRLFIGQENRPLRKCEHFQGHLGSIVDVRASTSINNRRKFKGKLIDAGPEGITVDCDGHLFDIPFNLLERARLRYFESLNL